MPKQGEVEVPPPLAKRTEDTIEYLPVRYTGPERLDLAEQLARASQAKGDAEDQKKAQDAEYKEQLEGLNLAIKRLSRKLTSGHEMRNVPCKWILEDPTPKEKTLVRLDTGEIVRVIPMQDRDFQETLPGVKSDAPLGEALVLEPPPDGKTAAAN